VNARYATSMLAVPFLLVSSIYAQTPYAQTPPSGADRATARTKQTWQIDSAHSKLHFSLRHLAGTVDGQFNVWSGTVTTQAQNWSDATVDVVIQASSIDTKGERRDNHLRSEDFFDVEKYPEITFKSTGVKRHGDSLTVEGKLTMKGVTKPVKLAGMLTGTERGPKPSMSFHATTTINRVDYGITYNRFLEGGGATIGDDVTIDITLMVVQRG